MNKVSRRTVVYTVFAIIGIVMFVLGEFMKSIDTFWSGMGVGFVIISAIRLIQLYRYKNDTNYAEKVKIQNTDERNRFIAEKARSMAFYYSILIAAILVIVLRVLNYNLASSIIGYAICVELIVYWLSYLWLKQRY